MTPQKRGVAFLLGLVFAIGLLGAMPTGALGAIGTSITVSPALAAPGQRVEVQLRTYVTLGSDALDLEVPPGYPAPSGLVYVLFPVSDYPFRVTATGPEASRIAVTLTPDPIDATLWRGWFQPDAAGSWVIRVDNFTPDTPGAMTELLVVAHLGPSAAPSEVPAT